MSEPRGDRCTQRKLGLGFGDVLDVNGLLIHDGPTRDRITIDRIREPAIARATGPVNSDGPELTSLDQQKNCVGRLAQPPGAYHDWIEDWLELCRGRGDHAQDLARGC